MAQIKYIVMEHRAVAIFDGSQGHNEVARSLHGKPAGAGFLQIKPSKSVEGYVAVEVYGESVSLGFLKNRGEVDEKIINKFLNGNDY